MPITRQYGWIADTPDFRDHIYNASYPGMYAGKLPESVDLRPGCPPVWNQGSLGSCTAHAVGAALEFDRKKQGLPDFEPSCLYLYWVTRSLEHTIYSDSGAQIRTAVKAANRYGVCPEEEWPYLIEKFMIRPPAKCWADAKLDRAVSYQRVRRDLTQMQACLASGYPFIFGFSVYESFERQDVAEHGIVPIPSKNEQLLGGHAVLCVGYRNDVKRFIIRNSWSDQWAMQGYCEMPYEYLLDKDLASDFWVIKTVGS